MILEIKPRVQFHWQGAAVVNETKSTFSPVNVGGKCVLKNCTPTELYAELSKGCPLIFSPLKPVGLMEVIAVL